MANMGYSTETITVIIVLLLACLHIAEVEAKPKLGLGKISHLHFYFHDLLEGTNMTVMGVASAPATDSSLTQLGMVPGESVAVKILQRGETPEEKARLETRFAKYFRGVRLLKKKQEDWRHDLKEKLL